MASPFRTDNKTGNHQPGRVNPQQPVLNVAPLNSMPYIGPPSPRASVSSTPPATEQEPNATERVGPAMIFLPSNSTREEVDRIIEGTRTGVALTGSAALGTVGPAIGAYDIAENDDSYLFRVALPGVARDEKDFCCDIAPDGKITIKGVTTTGEQTVCKYSQVFKMQTQNLCPPGHFCIEFQLPGPVNSQIFTGHLQDGVLEGIVKKI